MHRRNVVSSMVISAVAMLAASCGGTTEPEIGAVDTITDESQVSRPINSFLPGDEQLVRLWQVRGAAAAACYAEHGVQGREGVPPDIAERLEVQRVEDVTRSRLYGFFSPGTAQEHGYGSDFESLRLEVPAPWSPPEVVNVCERAGTEAVGSLPLVTDERILPDGGPPQATADSRVVAVVAKWSECMSEAGYQYQHPIEPLVDPRWQRPVSSETSARPPATPEEVAAATADVRCKVSTNLVGVAVAVQSAYDRRYIEAHADELSEFTDRLLGYTRDTTK
jgi:hypothetical protein